MDEIPDPRFPGPGIDPRLRYLVTRHSVATSTQFSASLSLSQAQGSHPAAVTELSSVFTLGTVHLAPACVSLATGELCHTLHTLHMPYINLVSRG